MGSFQVRQGQKSLLVFSILMLFVVILVISSCASAPAPIPEELGPAELLQKGQDFSERNQYQEAIRYYQAVLDRFSSDLTYICTAEYEIAFIHYKQKKMDEAEAGFRALLKRYDSPDAALLPAQFQVLSGKLLAKIEQAK